MDSRSSQYKEKDYWNRRYDEEESYEWFQDLHGFQSLLLPLLSLTDQILILGCGNSNLSENLYQLGYHHITNIDFSETVVYKMSQKTNHMKNMTWIVMDIRNLQFRNETFDIIIDKGTIDSLMVDQGSPWEPKKEVRLTVEKVFHEVSRALKSQGNFVSITFSQPHFRGHMIAQEQFDWSVKHSVFGTEFHYFFYEAVKGQTLTDGFDYSFLNLYNKSTMKNSVSIEESDESYLLNIDI